jgi:hypothetical protein
VIMAFFIAKVTFNSVSRCSSTTKDLVKYSGHCGGQKGSAQGRCSSCPIVQGDGSQVLDRVWMATSLAVGKHVLEHGDQADHGP